MRKTPSTSTKVALAPVTASVTMIVAHGEAEMISDAAPAAPAETGMAVALAAQVALIGDAPAAPDAAMSK